MNQKKVHVRIGDQVQLITGKEKGKKGKVLTLNRKKNLITIQDINFKVKHFKDKSKGEDNVGTIKQIEGPVHISNVKKIA
uniref:Large ribosomal subunit protein uL24c n=1 Tax=Olisthodiscus luteus TaxID=83000 RepID=A0A7U0KRY6_OLILU|nr:ribosomal protein L24 [Olisthodiscus luteus]QQW50585.1 ribosomal protein L24 [Olisthodiscus luteus]